MSYRAIPSPTPLSVVLACGLQMIGAYSERGHKPCYLMENVTLVKTYKTQHSRVLACVLGLQVVGAYSDERDFEAENALGRCSSKPGSLSGFDSSDSSDSKDDSKVGVNGADGSSDAEELFAVESNDGAGSSGLGDCRTVLSVAEVEVKHIEKMDTDTSVDNLFDSKISSYFSVNRESTSITLELEEETEIDGVAIGFFMKAASEERIMTFDVSVRAADGDWTTVISRKESSGEYKVVETFPFSSIKALYVRFESHGNTFNK